MSMCRTTGSPPKRRDGSSSQKQHNRQDHEVETAYAPPSSIKGCTATPTITRSGSQILVQLQNNNLRDPFEFLADDEVHLIIAHLPARDTETLRRVSKLWKATCEQHCGRSAILKHFPQAARKASECGSGEETNLQLRRLCTYGEVSRYVAV